jgi:two-component system, chemotaxis family, response regulator PixG
VRVNFKLGKIATINDMKAIESSPGKPRSRDALGGSKRTDSTLPKTLSDFHELLSFYSQRQFTGRLDVEVTSGEQWHLYLSLGRFVWASGGEHPTRRWRRQIVRTVTAIPQQEFAAQGTDRVECWDYHLLSWFAYQKLIKPSDVVALIRSTVAEVLFDIAQAIEFACLTQAAFRDREATWEEVFQVKSQVGVRPSTSETGILPRAWTVDLELIWHESQQLWQSWFDLGLGNCSPNLAPILTQPEIVQQQISRETYNHFAAPIDGKRTLRDLAALMQCDLLSLARSLLPHLQHHTIILVEIPDLMPPSLVQSLQGARREEGSFRIASRPLVACIDDCPTICHLVTSTLSAAGYEAFAIQEAVRALPTLLERKPNYILLDLTMPIINGYEICTQIRRVVSFKEIPVIILTGHDGLIDRIRAKVVGATDFLSKPIETQKVLQTLQKHNPKKKAFRSSTTGENLV